MVEVELSPRHRGIYDTHLQRERRGCCGWSDDWTATGSRSWPRSPGCVSSASTRRWSTRHDDGGVGQDRRLLDQLAEIAPRGTGRWCSASSPASWPGAGPARRGGIGYAYLDGRTRGRARWSTRSGRGPSRVPDQPQGRRRRAEPHRGRLRVRPRPLVEPGGRGAGQTGRTGSARPSRCRSTGWWRADTVEQKVVQLAARKAELFRSVLDGEVALGSRLTAADIASLVGSAGETEVGPGATCYPARDEAAPLRSKAQDAGGGPRVRRNQGHGADRGADQREGPGPAPLLVHPSVTVVPVGRWSAGPAGGTTPDCAGSSSPPPPTTATSGRWAFRAGPCVCGSRGTGGRSRVVRRGPRRAGFVHEPFADRRRR